jgi:serine protease Do
MSITTNELRAAGRRAAVPLIGGSALALGIALFAHQPVKAALTPAAPLDDSSVSSLVALDHSVEAVAAHVTPAVVNISVTAHAPEEMAMENGPDGQDGGDGDPMQQFRRFFGPGFGQGFGPGSGHGQHQQQIEHGIGSGIIVSPDGYIVTNNHVVNGAVQIRVTLHDRRTFPAKLIGRDKLTDLAVVKIDGSNLPSLGWGDSSKLEPGQTVLAFGSPFGYFQFSVTRGIVSALNRPNPYSDDAHKPGGYIQTDAAINPGNSGGPLVDAHGEVVGINTFLISSSGSFSGAGFAIPSVLAKPIVAQLIQHGKVEHGYLGIGINDVTPDNEKFFDIAKGGGAVVTQVTPDSPAGHAGLQVGDVITAINGEKVETASDLQMRISEATPGSSVDLTISRNGKTEKVPMTLGRLHSDREVAANAEGGENQSGKLGVAVTDLTPNVREQLNLPEQLKGVAVAQVRPASPAEDAGISNGDVILQVNRKPVESAEQFKSDVQSVPSGQDLLLLVWSNGGASYRVLHTASSTSNGM